MRRMFVRGLVRQLGSPALLAASYSGNAGAVANAAVCELEPALVCMRGCAWVCVRRGRRQCVWGWGTKDLSGWGTKD